MAKKQEFSFIRFKYLLQSDFNVPVVVDQQTQVEPGKNTEIADLFKQLDESGEVHSYEYSGDTPINIHGSDFADNETTYQGAYERFEIGDYVNEEPQMQQTHEVSAANAANEVSESPNDSSASK